MSSGATIRTAAERAGQLLLLAAAEDFGAARHLIETASSGGSGSSTWLCTMARAARAGALRHSGAESSRGSEISPVSIEAAATAGEQRYSCRRPSRCGPRSSG